MRCRLCLLAVALTRTRTLLADEGQLVKQASQPALWESILPMVVMFAVLYFVMIRPQTTRAKQQSEFEQGLRPGTQIVTSGGILGRVTAIQDGVATIDVGGQHVRVMQDHLRPPPAGATLGTGAKTVRGRTP